MKKFPLAAAVALGVALAGCNKQEGGQSEEVALDTQEKKVSYIIAEDMARRLESQDVALDPQVVTMALNDVAEGRDSRLSDEEKQQVIAVFQENMQAKQQEMLAKQEQEFKAKAEENQAKGEAFLAENAKKEGVVTTDSGLQYKVIREGSGDSPSADSTVEVDYKGTLIDGTEFDSSYARGEPVQFPVDGVIKGWTEALQLMKEGAKWELYIPSDLAYGPGGAGGLIGPNATLIFEVELHKANVAEGAGEEGQEKQDAEPAEQSGEEQSGEDASGEQ
ncbi:FKBP-type peptidyl-prolyl cis-trans isomerase [Microbulbifer yueqingensis]|uniref:Peptidyl-prolyl cis-trans isomerase n=1 Tax=Microbulbifer yueqingensis TaxID=658219 RepID=A0A1G9BHL6_9GAMM|nr:FKBP-type peptidyl-prolyl cis-trans isomerase [Microbulbifer yueqingensis]SDK39008.1 FKBP-type peptidyl-prolyl cis-trans isomerase FkpA/FKBP-type peptidyl-prolyl cis-trans isomerase FklB [Microbulbifer yueqingensis]